MLNDMQIERTLQKLERLIGSLKPHIFEKISSLEVTVYKTFDRLFSPPESHLFEKIAKGEKWGEDELFCWFKSTYTADQDLDNIPLFIQPNTGGYEGMLFVNKKPVGIYASKIKEYQFGNHYSCMFTNKTKKGEIFEIDIEFFAGNKIIGCFPFENGLNESYEHTFTSIDVCKKNTVVADFIFDLSCLLQLVRSLDKSSFRKSDIINGLIEIHKIIVYSIENTEKQLWIKSIESASKIIKPLLLKKNSESVAQVGVIGHSHMDTAWLWTIPETIKKCARTYSNQLTLMDQYPEYKFIQSSAYHLKIVEENYPELFERIKLKILEGKYEPNGGVWIECDCNITSGESIIRQFLWGQKYTQKHFNFTSNSFWLPDTFGYSAAIPQIMKGCKVDYFLTTKLSWNDTNTFPYDTFYWEGIDGTNVFVHFNCTHVWPDPQSLIKHTTGIPDQGNNYLKQKTVSNKRLVSYGYGDGGGGPQFEMIEMAKRCQNLEGCPKVYHTTVTNFMQQLEQSAVSPHKYTGELYLELHRGTFTNQHKIKYNNRKAEFLLRNLEIISVYNDVQNNHISTDTKIRNLYEVLLVNQFHDILPGTCIPKAHDQCYEQMDKLLHDAQKILNSYIQDKSCQNHVSIINTNSFDFEDLIYLKDNKLVPIDDKLKIQMTQDIEGNNKIAVGNLTIPPMSSKVIKLKLQNNTENNKSNFIFINNLLETPFAKIKFDNKGYFESFIDKRVNRELRSKNGYPLNALIFAEDVPMQWDNWDIDPDLELKMQDNCELISQEVISNGELEFRIRNIYKLSEKTTIKQDVIFYSQTARVDFDTIIDWNDKHKFLKAAFDTSIFARNAKHEIQFGYVERPTTKNNSFQQAMFEVVNHKYTDMSESEYGIAILNDCKYGISTNGSNMRLSLHKGGCRPDPRGDQGIHRMMYSFLPHNTNFSATSVIHPAYSINNPPIIKEGIFNMDSFINLLDTNIIIEAIKPCEENKKGFIVRLYESEGKYTNTQIKTAFTPKSIAITNMLEEPLNFLNNSRTNDLTFTPFEIKTILIEY